MKSKVDCFKINLCMLVNLKFSSLFWLFLYLLFSTASAQIKLPHVIGSNMVLQRNQPVPIWGWAHAGKTVKVKFGNQNKTTVADTGGYWKVSLSALAASNQPQDMLFGR